MKKFLLGLGLFALMISCAIVPYSENGTAAPNKSAANTSVVAADVSRASSSTPVNGTMMQYFHWYTPAGGFHWNEVASNAAALSQMGVTALWLPPAYKGSSGYDVGYGVYDMYDLGEFNQKGTVATKYGTKDQYLAAINAAHNNGIQIYADVVFNHRGGADETEGAWAVRVGRDNRNYEWGGDVWIDSWTGFTFPGRNNKYSSFKWHWYHFDGVDWAQNLGEDNIFKFRGEGKGWDWEVDSENQNYDYLMYADLDMDHPEVVQELKDWAVWYVNFANLDGFRMDAVKHIKYGFFSDWLGNVRYRTGKELFTVGEFWNYDVGKLNHFIDSTGGCMSLFDAPMHMNFYTASNAGGGYDMGSILNNTLTKVNPLKSVSIVENHDTQPCQALESCVNWWFKPLAYAIILLRQEGYPCVFYADLYGAQYSDKGYNINMAPVTNLDKLIKARKLYAYGTQHDYLDDSNIIGWTREGVSDIANSGCAVIMTDGAGGSKWMYVGTKFSGKKFYDYLGVQQDKVTINSDGWGQFWCDGGSVSVYVPFVETSSNPVLIDNGFETADGFAAKSSGTWTLTAEDGEWYAYNGYVNTTAKISGSYGAGLAAKGRYIRTPKVTNPKTLTFKAKASSTSANFTVDVQTSTDNSTWTTRASFAANGSNSGAIKSTASTLTANLNLTGSYYIRFYVSARSSGSFYFDDVYVSNVSSGSSTTTTTTTTTTVAATSGYLINTGFETADGFAAKSASLATVNANDGAWYGYFAISSAAKVSGTYGASLAAKNRYIRTPMVANPNKITFSIKASGTTSNYTIELQKSTDNATWTTVSTYAANGSNTGAIKTTAATKTKTVSLTGNYYFRWLMSARSTGTVYIDNVKIE
ncbi:MAG: alpha-amylase, partial [Spirochaetales bacterium]|nr:alpha-amylase [Spirochaetales bacterium]